MSVHSSVSLAEAADRLALRELFDAYAHCADRRDADGQKALFTEDTHFVVYMNGPGSEPSQDLEGREALTPVMEDFPKFINTQIDTTWRRFEILFSDMKQDRTNPGRPSPGNMLAVSQITGMAIQVNTDHSTVPPTATNWELWLDDVSFVP